MNVSRASVVLSSVCVLMLSACGGGSSGNSISPGDAKALCMQGCSKAMTLCYPDAGTLGATALSTCNTTCEQSASTCTNASAVVPAYQACLSSTTCTDLQACVRAAPACTGGGTGGSSGTGTGGSSGTGTGGSSGIGTGGSSGTGTGGTSGAGTGGASGTGSNCAALLACCNATTDATIKQVCTLDYSSVMAMGDAACAQALATIKSQACP